MHLIHPIGPYTHVLVCFIPFWCIWDHLVALPISEQNDVASEFCTTNAPDRPHWTLKSCFVAFPTIWVHLGPFGCLTKLGLKWAELVQKFVPRSRVGIFCNECTRWYETHRNMSLGSNGVDRVLSLRNVRATKSCQNFSQRTHPIHPIGP